MTRGFGPRERVRSDVDGEVDGVESGSDELEVSSEDETLKDSSSGESVPWSAEPVAIDRGSSEAGRVLSLCVEDESGPEPEPGPGPGLGLGAAGSSGGVDSIIEWTIEEMRRCHSESVEDEDSRAWTSGEGNGASGVEEDPADTGARLAAELASAASSTGLAPRLGASRTRRTSSFASRTWSRSTCMRARKEAIPSGLGAGDALRGTGGGRAVEPGAGSVGGWIGGGDGWAASARRIEEGRAVSAGVVERDDWGSPGAGAVVGFGALGAWGAADVARRAARRRSTSSPPRSDAGDQSLTAARAGDLPSGASGCFRFGERATGPVDPDRRSPDSDVAAVGRTGPDSPVARVRRPPRVTAEPRAAATDLVGRIEGDSTTFRREPDSESAGRLRPGVEAPTVRPSILDAFSSPAMRARPAERDLERTRRYRSSRGRRTGERHGAGLAESRGAEGEWRVVSGLVSVTDGDGLGSNPR